MPWQLNDWQGNWQAGLIHLALSFLLVTFPVTSPVSDCLVSLRTVCVCVIITQFGWPYSPLLNVLSHAEIDYLALRGDVGNKTLTPTLLLLYLTTLITYPLTQPLCLCFSWAVSFYSKFGVSFEHVEKIKYSLCYHQLEFKFWVYKYSRPCLVLQLGAFLKSTVHMTHCITFCSQ